MNQFEIAVLEIIGNYPATLVLSKRLRVLLNNRGFDLTAARFYINMNHMAAKGLVEFEQTVKYTKHKETGDMQPITQRWYRHTDTRYRA